jgi:PAS domain S-box-containing protein
MSRETTPDAAGVAEAITAVYEAVLRAEGRAAVEAAVCETLVDSGLYAAVRVGRYDERADTVSLAAAAGSDAEAPVESDGTGAVDLVSSAVNDAEPTVVDWESDGRGSVRSDGTGHHTVASGWLGSVPDGIAASAVVPLTDGETVFGAVTLHTTRGDAFDDVERTRLTRMAESVGHELDDTDDRTTLDDTDDRTTLDDTDDRTTLDDTDDRTALDDADERAQYERLTERISDAYAAVDRDWTITYWNDQIAARTGRDAEDVLGDRLWDAFPEIVGTEAETQYREAMADQEPRSFEQYVGEPYDYWVSVDIYPDEDGLSVFSRDITEQKRDEEALAELQRQTQRLMETSTVERTAEVAANAAHEVLGAPLCGVYRVDETGEVLEPVASVEEGSDEMAGPPTYYRDDEDHIAAQIVWDVFETGETREIDDVASVPGLAAQSPAESAIVYPLGDYGVFVVSATEPAAFDQTEKRYFELLALSLRTAFERVGRERRQQQRSEQLAALHEHSREIVSAADYETVARIAVDVVQDLLTYDGAGVHLVDDYHVGDYRREPDDDSAAAGGDDADDSPSELVPVEVSHPDGRGTEAVPALGPGSIAWEVYQSGEPYWTDDVQTDDRRHSDETDVGSELVVPLGEYGVLIVGSTAVGEFDETELTVCRILAANVTAGLEQVRRRRELEQSRDLLSRTEQLTDAGGWLYDAETETLRWTDGTRAIHEVPDDYQPSVGEGIDFYHPEDRDRIRELFTDCVESGVPYDERLRLVTAEGDLRWVQSRGEPVWRSERGETGESGDEIVGVRGTIRDVTEQRERARRLERQRDNLEILNEMVRHDVRNNLAVIGGYADTLVDHVDETGVSYVETIQRQAREATELTRSARDLAEVVLQTETDHERVAVQPFLDEEVESIRSTYDNAVVSVENTVPGVEVYANDMLGSVFRNLLKNSVQHNDEPVPEVTVSAERTNGTVEVSVADNGPGIPDDIRETVFEQGEKGLDSGGTGMGLYLVDSLVTEFDGDVWIEDNEPKGTVFVVQLPVAESVFGSD